MIPIQQYMGSLRRRGVRLWLDDGKLGYQAPKDTLTPGDLTEMRARKPELISFLQESALNSAPAVRPTPRTGSIPQSFAQRRLWFLYHLNGPDAAYNIVDRRRLRGPLDCRALEAAFREICRRHEILRTTFATADGLPAQIVWPEARPDFLFIEDGDAGKIAEEEAGRRFDLTKGPLLCVRLVRQGPEDHALLIAAHHLVCDGWSLGILFRELAALYRAFRRGEETPLLPPALQYADYAVWQHGRLSEGALETRLQYWQHLAGAPAMLDLFPEHPRSATTGTRGAAEPIRIEPEAAQRFRQLCQAQGCTAFMGMAAAFCVLLARYTRSRDIVLGTQVTGRDHGDLDNIVGFFVNTLALRIDVNPEERFPQLLDRVRSISLDAIAHQDVPFDRVVEMLRPERQPGRNPLVQVMLLWQNLPAGPPEFDGLKVEPLDGAGRSTAKFDLTLEMGESHGAFEGVLEYRSDFYTAQEIRRVSGHLRTLIGEIARDPLRPLRSLPMLPEAEVNALLRNGRGTAVSLPGATTIAARFRSRAMLHPQRAALVFGHEALSYEELDARSSGLAACLTGLGAAPERPVGIFLEPSRELIVAMLAVLKTGAFYVPLDTRSPQPRLATVLDDSGVSVILSVTALASLLPPCRAHVECVDGEIPRAHSFAAPVMDPANLAYMIYTSGSTGLPKGVMVAQSSVVNLAEWLGREVYGIGDAPVRTALLAPSVFDASVQQIFGCLLNGHTLYPVDAETRRDGRLLRRFFRQHRIGLADCTPALLAIMCEAGIPGDPDLALRSLLVGGEGLPASLVTEFRRQDREGRIALRNVYGPTECCVDSTCLTVDAATATGGILSIGSALPNCEIFILDPGGGLVPGGVPGEIAIGGAGVGRGYWKQPAFTAASFVPHPFRAGSRVYRTGDLGWWNADGGIEFLGRTDDQVKIRGHRIQLGDIETHLLRHQEVSQAAVSARETPEGQKELIAYFVGSRSLTVVALRRFLAEALPEYMVPSAFVQLDALPLNASGKVDRKRLPAPDAAPMASQGTEYVEPRTPEEMAIALVWSQTLGRNHIGIRDHYIALGGDSIKALQISAKLRDAGWKLELSDLFRHPHIEDLAPLLRKVNASAAAEILSEAPLAPVQLRFLEQFDGARNFFGQSVLLTPREPLAEPHLRVALQTVYRHHDALRSTFAAVGTKWVQRIPNAVSPVAFEIADCSAEELPALGAALQAGMKLETGPLFRAVLVRLKNAHRLLLAAHHMVIDGVSWRILLEDLESAYRQSAAGETVRLPARTTAVTNHARRLHDEAGTVLSSEYEWPSDASLRSAALVPDNDGPVCTAGECGLHSVRLPRALTAELLESCHRAYNTEANDLLLTGLARAILRHSGRGSAAILLEGHGREPVLSGMDVSRTVGWFTAIYPVLLDLGGSRDIGRQIKLVKESLRAIPLKGVGYGIARYIASDARLTEQPGVVFNYLGQFGEDSARSFFSRAPEYIGPMADPHASFGHDVEINAIAVEGELEFHLSYNPNRFTPRTITELARFLSEELAAIAAHTLGIARPELTPSDVDYDGFNLDEMEQFLDNLAAGATG